MNLYLFMKIFQGIKMHKRCTVLSGSFHAASWAVYCSPYYICIYVSPEVPAVCFVSPRVARVSLFTFLLPVCMHVSLAPLSFPLTLLTVSLCFIRYLFPCDSPCVSSRLPRMFHRLPVYPWCHVKPVSLTSASLCFLFYFDGLACFVSAVPPCVSILHAFQVSWSR